MRYSKLAIEQQQAAMKQAVLEVLAAMDVRVELVAQEGPFELERMTQRPKILAERALMQAGWQGAWILRLRMFANEKRRDQSDEKQLFESCIREAVDAADKLEVSLETRPAKLNFPHSSGSLR